MVLTNEREKLLQAIVFFAWNTKNCSKTKLLKLLFLLDFEHFKLTGRSVTGLRYSALPLGPVPTTVYAELDAPADDFAAAVEQRSETFFGWGRKLIVPKRDFDSSNFTRRELKLLRELSERYQDQTAKDMVDVVHAENGVWDRVWKGGEGVGHSIPYELALDGHPSRDAIIAMQKEYEALVAAEDARRAA